MTLMLSSASLSYCNAQSTFQRSMMAIFHDMMEDFVKVFMYDFSVIRNSFEVCLQNVNNYLLGVNTIT